MTQVCQSTRLNTATHTDNSDIHDMPNATRPLWCTFCKINRSTDPIIDIGKKYNRQENCKLLKVPLVN